jgi:hypothetical protein
LWKCNCHKGNNQANNGFHSISWWKKNFLTNLNNYTSDKIYVKM